MTKRLTKPQRLVFDMEKFAGGAIAVICGSVMVQGSKELSALKHAVQTLYRLNAALRIRIEETPDGVVQTVSDYIEQEVEVLRFENKTQFDIYAESYAKDSLDIYGSLCDIKVVLLGDSYGILVKLHHIIGDAWTLSLIASQFCAVLNEDMPETYSYLDYLDSEETYMQSSRYAKDRNFFLEQFRECDEVTYLSEKQVDSFETRRKTFVIEGKQAKQITEYIKQNNTSAFVLFMTALAAYINRTKMNVEKFYIGTAVLNRSGVREKNTMGMFINTVPMLMKLDNGCTFAENLSSVQHAAFSIFRHQKYNYGDVLADIRKEYAFTEKMYDVMLSYQNATITGATGEFESTWYHSGVQTESLQIHIDDRDNEGIFRIHFDYQTEKFTEQEIERMYEHITNLLFDAIESDSKKLYELEILSAHEKQKLLHDFNDTAVDYPRDKCVHELFEEQVTKTPDKTAVIACDGTLTYAQLNEQANRIAHGLIAEGVKSGDIVAFALHRKSYLIAAIFGILKSGAAYMPIDIDYPQERVEYMLKDSGAKLFITDDSIEKLLANGRTDNPAVSMSSEDLCYCIYTSGSTGMPKGVLIKHRNFVNICSKNRNNDYQKTAVDQNNTLLSTAKCCFDAFGIDYALFLLNGNTMVLASDDDITDGGKLAELIEKYPISVIQSTPSTLSALCINENYSCALSRIKVIILAAENFFSELFSNLEKLTDAIVFNGYGPSETTIGASIGRIYSEDVNIGRPIANTQIYIVDQYMQPVPVGVTGELCIAGDGVGAGYLHRPELTAEKFIDNPFGEGKLYKTGDLAYWREDGNIAYVGRNDYQVKIRGLRVELGEIENAIDGVEGISEAVVVVRKNGEGRQFICAFYTGKEMDAREIRNQIGKRLPKYMLPHSFTHLDALSLTASGKADRKALPEIDLSSVALAVEYVAPSTLQEKALTSAIEAVLSVERVGVLDNFFDLGGDSLKSIELIARLEKAGYHVDTKTIFACDIIKELAESLEVAKTQELVSVIPEDVPATHAQMRVYTAQSIHGESTMYNMPCVIKVNNLNPKKLEQAIIALIDRHEMLRTRFENKDGQIIQVVENHVPFALERLTSDDISAFVRPFDLSRAPLLRVGYCENTVMIDMHHIVTDGTSLSIFLQELNEVYMGRDLGDTPASYRQFAVQEVDYQESEKYWLSIYEDELPVLELNTDFRREQKRSFNGNAIYDFIDSALHHRILAKCRELNITPYVFYMSGFYILLSKFSGNEDVVVGMPISGREGKYLNTIGMFVNTIALRSRPEGDKSVKELLKEVKNTSIDAIAHQEYPYGELVKKLNINSVDRNPLFDVMFAYQSEAMTNAVFGDERAELRSVPITTAKYDFTFNVMPGDADVVLMAEYCTDLYRENTMRRFLDGYKLVLEQMLRPDTMLKDVSAITPEEEHTLRFTFNDTAVDYPRDKCVHELFEERVSQMPDVTALVFENEHFTYRQLDEMSNALAHFLRKKGIGRGDIVSIIAKRSWRIIVAMLGILKSGAAYVPIDPLYPKERIEDMVDGAKCRVALTCDYNESLNIEKISLNCFDFASRTDPVEQINSSDDLCYVIFTSGSTGKPKGVSVCHRNVVNFCDNNFLNVCNSIISDRAVSIVSVTNFVFDIFVTESILPLLSGITIYLANDEQVLSQQKISELILSADIDVIQTTPTKMRSYILDKKNTAYLAKLKAIVLGGEALPANLYTELQLYTDAHIYNIYGPTETTVWSTSTAASHRNDKCVYQYFEKQVAQTPDTVAVICKDRTFTYSQLRELVDEYSSKLSTIGIKANNVIAVHIERSYRLIAFQLAILKIGAIFLPIDKRYPIDRIRFICSDCNAALLISDEITSSVPSTKVLSLEAFEDIKARFDVDTVIDVNVCYVIYTSGSTGSPKGCQLTNVGLVNFCINNNTLATLKDGRHRVFACVNSVSFDYFIAETLLPLLNGYTTVMLDDAESTIQQNFLDAVKQKNINVLMTTPTRLNIYFSDDLNCSVLKQLDCICTSGEPLPPELLLAMQRKSPYAHIYNPMGPSECSVWSVGGKLNRADGIDIHIGKPIANTQVYIVDRYMKLCPIGVTGELCIAGDGVGAGYLNRPELTAEKFIDNPFGEGKLYKTGDLAYWREDGNIAYVGRNDFQVKIRGLRIELGEIENSISAVDGISQAVVTVRKDNEGRQLICAFYTETVPTSVEQIKTVIRDKLPRYMMPHIFALLPEMPLTSSGKVNRNALPEVNLSEVERSVEYINPEGQIEKQLASLIETVLHYSPIGRQDSFFDLGGDSLKAIEFVAKAHAEGIYIALQNVFDYPTVQQLADYIKNGDSQQISYEDTDFSGINTILSKNSVAHLPKSAPQITPVGNILLAGATGYLGVHILADYLEYDSGTAYCLVRGKDESDSRSRLAELLEFYFGDKYTHCSRIQVVCGDLQKEHFGLTDSAYSELISEVDTVINAAASVKHYGSYKYFHEVNVESAQRLIAFCVSAEAKLVHTSTLSVSGNSFGDHFDGYISDTEKHFYESDLYIGQSLENVYARSKFEAEKVVLEAMEHGLRANIMRMGNLTNRLSDGVFQRNHESNAFLQRLRGALELGVLPDYLLHLYVEFTPIDEAAAAVMTIARHFSTEQTVFHIDSNKVIYMDKLVEHFNSLDCPVSVICGENFAQVLRESARKSEMEHVFEAFINDLDESDKLNYDSNIHIDSNFTVQYLEKLGFEWADIGLEYLRKYIDYFKRIGYLK